MVFGDHRPDPSSGCSSWLILLPQCGPPMRVLQINKYLQVRGGADRAFFQTVRLLADHGHEVTPFGAWGASENASARFEFFVDDLQASDEPSLLDRGRIFLRGIYNRQAQRRLERLVAEKEPQIAHLHNIHYQISPSILPTLRRLKIPVVMTLHDYRIICPNGYLFTQGALCERCKGGHFQNALVHRCLRDSWGASVLGAAAAYTHGALDLYRYIDRFVAPSVFLRQKMLDFGYAADRVRVIRNFFDAHTPTASSPGEPYFVWAGYMVVQKGAQLLLEAIHRIGGARLFLAGEGPYFPRLRDQASREGLIGRVSFTGFMRDRDLWSLMGRCRAVVVPSIWYENSPMVILEAYSLGRPVIATAIGGIPEMVEDGQTGILVPPGDIKALAEAMQWLLDNPAQALAMGMAGQRLLEDRFSPQAHHAALMDVYAEVLDEEA